jgi:rare lipoprotein A (peptidoglycan hydrolase)
MRLSFVACSVLITAALGCSSQLNPTKGYLPLTSTPQSNLNASTPHVTLASWYGPGFNGRSTSTGEVFDSNRLTAASRALPLGSHARVTNLDNGQSVVVLVNDHGPYVRGRGIDLSQAAAERLGFKREGVVRVRVTRLVSTASTTPLKPERWVGTARVRPRHHVPNHRHARSRRSVRNPLTTWLLVFAR